VKGSGNVFTSYYSSDGAAWTQLGTATLALSASATVGMFVTAHTDAALCTTVFDNVKVTGGQTNTTPAAQNQSVATTMDTPVGVKLTATDADNDPLIYAVVSRPANGTLSGTAPNLTYTPKAGFTGSDAFTFKANHGKQDSATATVSINVAAAAPPSPCVPSG
jgi:hypothetical protein